jgi:hypothetical protein
MGSSATELTTVLANLAPVGASWRVLGPYRNDFKGSGAKAGCPAAAHGPARGCRQRGSVRSTVAGVATSRPRALLQRRGCRRSTYRNDFKGSGAKAGCPAAAHGPARGCRQRGSVRSTVAGVATSRPRALQQRRGCRRSTYRNDFKGSGAKAGCPAAAHGPARGCRQRGSVRSTVAGV